MNFSRSAPPKVRSNLFLAATSRSIEALFAPPVLPRSAR
nr:MAG TPA: hypothetical protein [Caudoviricetes sp.]